MKPEYEDLVRRFLLGEMAEQERFEFEELFVADADLFEQINVIEGELIEKYVRGWMQPDERAVFEKNFLTTNKRRERVEFSRALIIRVETKVKSDALADGATNASKKESFFGGIHNWFRLPQIAMVGAMGILIALFGTWLFFQNVGLNRQEVVIQGNTEVLETPQTTISPELNISPENSPVNSNEKPEANERSPTPDNSANGSKDAPVPEKTSVPTETPEIRRSPPNPVFALFPGTVRSNGKNNVLILRKNSTGAIFQLRLDATEYKIYAAQILNADGRVIAQFNNLKASKNSVRVFVSADKLSKGDYLMKLSGKNGADENDSVADFQFRVQ